MRVNRFSLGLRTAWMILAVVLFATTTWAADHETVLHSFNFTDGWMPAGGLIFDTAGNLYGTTSAGGVHDN